MKSKVNSDISISMIYFTADRKFETSRINLIDLVHFLQQFKTEITLISVVIACEVLMTPYLHGLFFDGTISETAFGEIANIGII